MTLVNLGCGRRIHPAWQNLDLTASVPGVIEHDLRRGLPFADNTCEAVYHSHVLEHLEPEEGRGLIAECFRVLRPGGVLRVVVPDLEGITKQYLASLDAADSEQAAKADHEWMTVELLDQMVRTRSGGRMRRYFDDAHLANRPFIVSRLGSEVTGEPAMAGSKTLATRVKRSLSRLQRTAALAAATLVGGKQGYRDLKEVFFRRSGEVHRWMYDRVSLARLLAEAGFGRIARRTAFESAIPKFASYELDTTSDQVRKPDSLFMEGVKS
ncbi:MAG TPA: methyltransferase domain-containing protein [Pirellulaceae bacterium]|nr:methyltransferase domain-containing protein [Pirellulaceae bacterium]